MKIKFLILLIVPILLTNCGKDESGKTYEGTWIGTSLVVSACEEEEDNTSETLTCDDAATCYSLNLKGDGSFSYQEGLPLIEGAWSISGSSLVLCSEEEGENVCVTYSSTIGAELILTLTDEQTACVTTITFVRQ